MEQDKLKWTKYEPMDMRYRQVVASVADDYGLVSHEFGEEEIDRFIIVYKPEFTPSDDELSRMALKYDRKLDDEAIERIVNPEQVEEKPKKPQRRKKNARDAEEEHDVGELKLHAVGTVKRVRRDAAQAMEEIRKKKLLTTAPSMGKEEQTKKNAEQAKKEIEEPEIDSLFFQGQDELEERQDEGAEEDDGEERDYEEGDYF